MDFDTEGPTLQDDEQKRLVRDCESSMYSNAVYCKLNKCVQSPSGWIRSVSQRFHEEYLLMAKEAKRKIQKSH